MLAPLIEAETVKRPTDAWVADLEARVVPCSPINTLDRVFADPQVKHRGLARATRHASGAEIPIEERDASEVTEVRGIPVAPVGQRAANPSFDVTPAAYISAIITERGVARAPFAETLRKQVNEAA